MYLFYTLVFLLLSSPIHALEEQSFEGLIYKSAEQFYFRDKEDRRLLKLLPTDHWVRRDLSKLESGDALLGSGYIEENSSTLHLSSVHFVGLKKILGTWRAKSHAIFEFASFNDLNIYHPNGKPTVQSAQNTPRRNYQAVKSYQYTVAPNAFGKWSILINDDTTINTGKLEIQNDHLLIHIVDSQSGKIVETYSLQRTF